MSSWTECWTATRTIDRMRVEIDGGTAFRLLALHQPITVDLRAIHGSARINSDILEQ